jgi:hypothetical protein
MLLDKFVTLFHCYMRIFQNSPVRVTLKIAAAVFSEILGSIYRLSTLTPET